MKGAGTYPTLSFSATISKRNIYDIKEIFALAARFKVDQVILNEEDPEVEEEQKFVLDPADRAVFETQWPSIEASGVRCFNNLSFGQAGAVLAATDELFCLAPWKVFYLRADGAVHTCCTLRTSMGDMREKSFEQIWNGEAYVSLRRSIVERTDLPTACRGCTDPYAAGGDKVRSITLIRYPDRSRRRDWNQPGADRYRPDRFELRHVCFADHAPATRCGHLVVVVSRPQIPGGLAIPYLLQPLLKDVADPQLPRAAAAGEGLSRWFNLEIPAELGAETRCLSRQDVVQAIRSPQLWCGAPSAAEKQTRHEPAVEAIPDTG